MDRTLAQLAGIAHREAGARRMDIATLALATRNEAAARLGGERLESVRDYLRELSARTVCITLLAGSGSRWVRSLEAAGLGASSSPWLERGAVFDPSRPRGLFPVRNWIRERGVSDQTLIPVAAYALHAVHGLGRHLIVVRGWEREIDEEILRPLGIGPGERDFCTQEAHYGKPLGHGDAVWQCRALWKDADYVITNFGGDANSRRTLSSSLLALDALGSSGGVDLLMPAATTASPAYPISLDDRGLPRSFGHAKLQQGAPRAEGRGPTGDAAYTNVGVRVYRARALLESVERFRSAHWIEGSGYAIPGNDPQGHEFALDNVDADMAGKGRARILAMALPRELTPAKSLEDIPAFEAAMAEVIAEDEG